MPSPALARPRHPDRRQVLLATIALGGVPLLARCASDETAVPTDGAALRARREQAEADAAMAAAVAARAGEQAAAVLLVRAHREAHAQVLAAEWRRTTGRAEPTDRAAGGNTEAATAAGETTSAAPTPEPTPATLRTALRASAAAAESDAATSTGFTAGLLAAVATSCRADEEILLG